MIKKLLLGLGLLSCSLVTATVLEPTNRTVFKTLAKNNLVVVKFSAPWCGPCRAIKPAYKRLSDEYTDIKFIEIDIDQMSDVASSWKIRSIPAFVFLNDGQQISKFIGADEAQLKKHLDSLLTSKK